MKGYLKISERFFAIHDSERKLGRTGGSSMKFGRFPPRFLSCPAPMDPPCLPADDPGVKRLRLAHYATCKSWTARTGRFQAFYSITTSRRECREAGFMRGPGRREWTRLPPSGRWTCCSETSFHTIRLVSEVLESNGSTSMASVCRFSGLMDAGVPVARFPDSWPD